MQDIVYKIFKKLANNKEKIVLLIMLFVVAYYLFLMFQPVEPGDNSAIQGPKIIAGVPDVPAPSVGPMIDISENYNALIKQNFFWVHSEKKGQVAETRSRDIGIKFLDIQETAGKYRVQLKTTSTTAWYVEGAKFEDFEILEINPETNTIVVYTTIGTRQVTIPLEQ